MRTDSLSFDTANGATTAYTAIPDGDTNKGVLVIQEYWGLNDHVRDIANRWAGEGFIAIAPDLYRGKLAATADEAGKLMQALKIDDGIDIIRNAMDKARDTYDLSHFGINGFCMGGTYTLRAACELEGLSAAAAFYGDVPEEDVLQKLTVPTIFVSATKDKWINPEKVAASRGRRRPVRAAPYQRQIRSRPRLFQQHPPRGLQRNRRPRRLGPSRRIFQ